MLTIVVQILSNKCASLPRSGIPRAPRTTAEAAKCSLRTQREADARANEAQRIASGGVQCTPPGVDIVDVVEAPERACAFRTRGTDESHRR
jgi:hypothetical protein